MSAPHPVPNGDSKVLVPNKEDDHGPIVVLRKLKAGKLTAKQLSQEDRIACVEYLTLEGHSCAEIADVLQVSTRTVFRNRQAVREKNAIRQDPELASKMVGRLMQDAEQAVSRLRKFSRDRDCPYAVRVEAERSAWQVMSELTELLQSLEFLPTAASRIRADLKHSLVEPPSIGAILAEAERVESIANQSGGTSADVREKLARLREFGHRQAAIEEIKEIEVDLVQEEQNDD